MDKNKPVKVAIGERLRQARERAALTPQEAADSIDVQVSAIGAWERGTSMPTLVQFRNLLSCYGTMGHHLLFGDNPMVMTAAEQRELLAASRSFSPSLRRKIDMLQALLAEPHPGQLSHH